MAGWGSYASAYARGRDVRERAAGNLGAVALLCWRVDYSFGTRFYIGVRRKEKKNKKKQLHGGKGCGIVRRGDVRPAPPNQTKIRKEPEYEPPSRLFRHTPSTRAVGGSPRERGVCRPPEGGWALARNNGFQKPDSPPHQGNFCPSGEDCRKPGSTGGGAGPPGDSRGLIRATGAGEQSPALKLKSKI